MSSRSEDADVAVEPDEPIAPAQASGNARPRRKSIAMGPLDERLGYLLRRAQIAVFDDFIRSCRDLGIKGGQYSILTVIETNPGLTQSEVADTLGIKKPNFVAMVDRFEARGLVTRSKTPGDRRSHALFLTAEGKALMRKLHRRAAQHENRIIEAVGEDAHRRLFDDLQAIAAMSKRSAGKT